MVKVDPALCRLKKLSQRPIPPALSSRLFKRPNEALRIAIIGWGASSTHRTNEAFLHQRGSCLFCSLLTSLIGMEDRSRHRKRHLLTGRDDEIRLHPVIKGKRENVPGALPERKAATYFGSICQSDLKEVGNNDLWWGRRSVRTVFVCGTCLTRRSARTVLAVLMQRSQQVGHQCQRQRLILVFGEPCGNTRPRSASANQPSSITHRARAVAVGAQSPRDHTSRV